MEHHIWGPPDHQKSHRLEHYIGISISIKTLGKEGGEIITAVHVLGRELGIEPQTTAKLRAAWKLHQRTKRKKEKQSAIQSTYTTKTSEEKRENFVGMTLKIQPVSTKNIQNKLVN